MKKQILFILLLGLTTQAKSDQSCDFIGVFSNGCHEFVGPAWSEESMLEFCQSMAKDKDQPILSPLICERDLYNTLCVNDQNVDAIIHTYANNMPAFICSKYLGGTLTKRPKAGEWP